MSKEIPVNNKIRWQNLVTKSLDTLETLLADTSLPAKDRALIAAKVLQLSQTGTPFGNTGNGVSNISSNAQTSAKTEKPVVVPIHCMQVDNFLAPDECEAVFQEALRKESEYADSTVYQGEKPNNLKRDVRDSLVLYERSIPELAGEFKEKLMEYFPEALNQLKIAEFKPSNIILQLTTHNDGGYYKMHSDASTKSTSARKLTYVYYFNKEPQAFSGGELRLFDTEIKDGRHHKRTQFLDVKPRNNRIVFFDSRLLHEVMPVRCASGQFVDGRFTINGWVCQ